MTYDVMMIMVHPQLMSDDDHDDHDPLLQDVPERRARDVGAVQERGGRHGGGQGGGALGDYSHSGEPLNKGTFLNCHPPQF